MGPESNETEPAEAPGAGETLPEAAPAPGEVAPAAAEPAATAGEPAFRVVGLQSEWLTDPVPEGLEGAVSAELSLRVQRLAQAVDSALLLSDEGVVRFMGEPIARLTRGEETLNPKVLLLADSRLTEAERTTAQARVEAWIVGQFRKILGPLLDLYALQSDTPAVKAVAERMVKGLGIVERTKVQREVRSLDQPSRGVLREKGVRFGSHYVFLPALLKPAARKLAATLWERTSGVAMFDGPRAALALGASAGRTSLAVDPGINAADCQMFGYRLCGDRAVRIDIIERLADLIRAQLSAAKAPADGGSRPYGFAVLPQMTSMSGCSHEQFAGVLRSLGYENFEATIEPSRPGETAPALQDEAAPAGDEPSPDPHEEAAAEADAMVESEAAAVEPAAEAESAAEAEPVEEVEAPPADDVAPPPEAEAEAQAPAAEAAPAETTVVELWRPAPRSAPPPRPQKRERTPREWNISARPAAPERPKHEKPPASVAGEAGAEAAAQEKRHERPRPPRRDAERPARARPEPVIDKDSPFYKLMALREQLAKK